MGHERDTNALSWFVYNGDHNIQGRWGIHAELQLRRAAVLLRPQQLLVRPALNIKLTSWATAALGYAYSKTYPYGAEPDPFAFPEHRIYEEITFSHDARRGRVSHRVRMEQRFISDAGTIPEAIETEWRYANRLRYSVEFQHPLARSWYYTVSAEPQARFGVNYRGRVVDQLQTYGAFGYKLSRDWMAELGYSYQVGVPRRGRVYETNHIIRLTIRSTARVPKIR
jgi:hypothetical protein